MVMNQSYYDDDYPQTNRDKAMRPIRSKGWCEHCDRNIVASWCQMFDMSLYQWLAQKKT